MFKSILMKAFETKKEKIHWVRIKDGRLCYWNGEKELIFEEMQGLITGVNFKNEEYQGRKYTEAIFTLYFESEKYFLSVNTDTSYFRSFCNYLANADLKKPVLLRPKITEKENKKSYSIFVQQEGKWLKAYFTKEKPGLPELVVLEVAGKKIYDNTGQIEFWKHWLINALKDNEPEINDLPF